MGTHHGVSHQHLQAYLNEFTFRFNRRFYPFNAFRSLLGIAGDVTAPTYAELYSGEWQHTSPSALIHTYDTPTIPFPAFPEGERALAMRIHRQACSTHREGGKRDPPGGFPSSPAALRAACDAPHRGAPRA